MRNKKSYTAQLLTTNVFFIGMLFPFVMINSMPFCILVSGGISWLNVIPKFNSNRVLGLQQEIVWAFKQKVNHGITALLNSYYHSLISMHDRFLQPKPAILVSVTYNFNMDKAQ